MKKEKRYQTICEMIQAYDQSTGNRGADHVINNPYEWINNKYQPFYANAAQLLIETMEALDTNNTGDKTIMAALKRIIKSAGKNRNFDGIFETIGDDNIKRYAVCDGYRLIRLNKDYKNMQHATDPRIESDTFNKAIKGSQRDEIMPLPSIADVKAFIAQEKARPGKSYKANQSPYNVFLDVWVNPEYLLDMLQALPGCKAYKPVIRKNPIYFEAENGDGILLPINIHLNAENAA